MGTERGIYLCRGVRRRAVAPRAARCCTLLLGRRCCILRCDMKTAALTREQNYEHTNPSSGLQLVAQRRCPSAPPRLRAVRLQELQPRACSATRGSPAPPGRRGAHPPGWHAVRIVIVLPLRAPRRPRLVGPRGGRPQRGHWRASTRLVLTPPELLINAAKQADVAASLDACKVRRSVRRRAHERAHAPHGAAAAAIAAPAFLQRGAARGAAGSAHGAGAHAGCAVLLHPAARRCCSGAFESAAS
jgi:hypothetical protein